MSGPVLRKTVLKKTVLKNPQVREYLRMLDAATATLPVARSRELREQITAHLEEALPPDAGPGTIRVELWKLGHPRELAAEAGPVPASALIRLRNRLSRVRWRAWTSIGVVIVVAATVLTYVLLVGNVRPLFMDGISSWYFPRDSALSVETSAGTVTQYTVPERFGQQQGFVIGVENNSDWTQTIVGFGANWPPASMSSAEVAVGSGPAADSGGIDHDVRWDLPESIPPHSLRLLRVLWTSETCLGPGGDLLISDVPLRVRVGLFTRTVDLPLGITLALSGTKASSCQ